ncbi:MAG: uracil-DNA glycosylase [Gammaproteobacteria bacterium CG_4_10_14_0_8_um_filter_38_16]|nr:MAG: uracil-DNA glycosylase [Gammaproteobacteria bacterium CG_4_10_14_0_8_um_filter_38_16]PJA03052.1 MAG: uracil-DNA glycosylase [Gammaproteobacteria bacterium CG_4_10_14_0_2_um_filter_38_22]PJB10218.1 MAG: uracil-DNA glycosylase [Gammaproteobacteria bacterium CG_4_9_14_3_um_filter_38_9]
MQDWEKLLAPEKQKKYFLDILHFLKQERAQKKIIYPKACDTFNAIESTPFSDLKVVIIGQDPYHNPGQAHGLSFSVPKGIAKPPSLINIFKALKSDCGIEIPNHGCLEKWATQGVLLLNSVLTVEQNKPASHAHIGWQQFTDIIIQKTNEHPEQIVYLLWGAYAQKKQILINTQKHIVLTAPHPSPLSAHRGFLSCKHFSKTNEFLKKAGRIPIDWQL